MPWRTTFHNTVITPLPSDVDPEALINLLHDHGYIITYQPLVTHYEERNRDSSSGRVIYDVWETIHILPCWSREIQFEASFIDKPDGAESQVNAPMGFTSNAEYLVRPRKAEDGDLKANDGMMSGEWVLEEQIESTCNVIFKLFVQRTMVPARREMQLGLIEKAREESRGKPQNPIEM